MVFNEFLNLNFQKPLNLVFKNFFLKKSFKLIRADYSQKKGSLFKHE